MWLHGCLINRVKFFHIIFSAIRNLLQAHNVSSLIICSAYDIRKQTVFSFAIARRHQIIQHFILPMYVFISKFRVRLDSFNLDHSITQLLVERPFSNLTTADTCKLNNVQNTGLTVGQGWCCEHWQMRTSCLKKNWMAAHSSLDYLKITNWRLLWSFHTKPPRILDGHSKKIEKS